MWRTRVCATQVSYDIVLCAAYATSLCVYCTVVLSAPYTIWSHAHPMLSSCAPSPMRIAPDAEVLYAPDTKSQMHIYTTVLCIP